MQEMLQKRSQGTTVRDLASAAVPQWEVDFERVMFRPDFRLMDFVFRGGEVKFWQVRMAWWTAEFWVSTHKALVATSALALGVLAGGSVWWRGRLRGAV